MAHRLALLAGAIATVTLLAAQLPAETGVPRLWTNGALAGLALPIAGVKAASKFYSEAEYYAAPVDEVRTYAVYIKGREPEGYREWMRKQGPQPLIEPAKLTSEADWIAAGRDVFDGLHLGEFRTADPRAFRWARTVRALGLDCVTSKSGSIRRGCAMTTSRKAGTRRIHGRGPSRPPVRIGLSGQRQTRAHRVSEDALTRSGHCGE